MSIYKATALCLVGVGLGWPLFVAGAVIGQVNAPLGTALAIAGVAMMFGLTGLALSPASE